MAKEKRQSPGIGHNGNLPSHADVRTAMAIEMIFAERERELREQKKRARKKIEGMGIPLHVLGFLKEAEKMTGSELEQHFRLHWHLAGAIHEDVHEQLDIFAPKASAPEKRAAHFTMGLLAGLAGKDFAPPPMVAGDDLQQMTKGYEEGRQRRETASTDIIAKLMDPENAGKTFDGKTGQPKESASKVNDKAAADFAKDNADDPLMVGGEKYPTVRAANAARKRLADQQTAATPEPEVPVAPEPTADADDVPVAPEPDPEPESAPEEVRAEAPRPRTPVARPDFQAWSENWEDWSGSQTMEFRRWFESLPDGTIPAITHPGAVAYFNRLRQEMADRDLAGPSDEDAPAPESKPEPELDEAGIAAAAKKLQDSGFVPPKKTRTKAKA